MTREFGRGQVNTPLHEIIYLVGVVRCSYRKQICLIYQIRLKYFKSFMHHFVWKKEQWNNYVFTNYESRVCWFKTTRWFHGQDLVVSSKLSPWNGSTGLRQLNSILERGCKVPFLKKSCNAMMSQNQILFFLEISCFSKKASWKKCS